MPLQRRGVHWPQDHTDHHNSDRPSASTSTWQARGRREPGIQACLLKTQGHLRNFPKRKPNNKVDKEILKRHTDLEPLGKVKKKRKVYKATRLWSVPLGKRRIHFESEGKRKDLLSSLNACYLTEWKTLIFTFTFVIDIAVDKGGLFYFAVPSPRPASCCLASRKSPGLTASSGSPSAS